MIPTEWLIAAVIVLPAVWGWLCEESLRRLWPGTKNRSPRTHTDPGGGAVDFQI